jgi:Uma2 family endonuclease
MSTLTAIPPTRTTAPGGETRICVPRATWSLYRSFVEQLPESTPIRVAFDGRSMEIMVKGPVHDHFAALLATFLESVAGVLGVRIKPMRETTWIRPEIERGIEADNCYYLDPEKISVAFQQIRRLSNDVANYPNPDLVVEVDISPPQADRMGIFAALGVTEVWIFDGQELTIHRLGPEKEYAAVERSGFFRVAAKVVAPWLLEEDHSDHEAWVQRVRAWAATLRDRG